MPVSTEGYQIPPQNPLVHGRSEFHRFHDHKFWLLSPTFGVQITQRPTPEWGSMIKDSLELLYLEPWTVLLPGFAIIFTILLSIIFSNGLIKAINQYYE